MVVFHNTGILNTVKVRNKLKPGKILDIRRDLKPNTGSLEIPSQPMMVTTQQLLERHQVSKPRIMKLTSLMVQASFIP